MDYDSNFSSWHILTSLCYDKVLYKGLLVCCEKCLYMDLKFDRERDTLFLTLIMA